MPRCSLMKMMTPETALKAGIAAIPDSIDF